MTIILAFINGKYNCRHGLLFIGTFIIDIEIVKLLLTMY